MGCAFFIIGCVILILLAIIYWAFVGNPFNIVGNPFNDGGNNSIQTTTQSNTASIRTNAPSPTSPKPTGTTDTKTQITNEASDLNFTINDFPTGWQMTKQGESGNGHEITAVKLFTVVVEDMVVSWVGVFPSVDAAELEFESRRGELSNFRLDDPNIGDNSYIYEGGLKDEVLFRVENVIGQVTMFTQFGGSLGDVEKWAKKLEERIGN